MKILLTANVDDNELLKHIAKIDEYQSRLGHEIREIRQLLDNTHAEKLEETAAKRN